MPRPKGSKNKPKQQTLDLVSEIKEIKPAVKSERSSTIIEGWVNVQKHEYRPKKFVFYTGGDIHETQEEAKRVATKQTVGQVFIKL